MDVPGTLADAPTLAVLEQGYVVAGTPSSRTTPAATLDMLERRLVATDRGVEDLSRGLTLPEGATIVGAYVGGTVTGPETDLRVGVHIPLTPTCRLAPWSDPGAVLPVAGDGSDTEFRLRASPAGTPFALRFRLSGPADIPCRIGAVTVSLHPAD